MHIILSTITNTALVSTARARNSCTFRTLAIVIFYYYISTGVSSVTLTMGLPYVSLSPLVTIALCPPNNILNFVALWRAPSIPSNLPRILWHYADILPLAVFLSPQSNPTLPGSLTSLPRLRLRGRAYVAIRTRLVRAIAQMRIGLLDFSSTSREDVPCPVQSRVL